MGSDPRDAKLGAPDTKLGAEAPPGTGATRGLSAQTVELLDLFAFLQSRKHSDLSYTSEQARFLLAHGDSALRYRLLRTLADITTSQPKTFKISLRSVLPVAFDDTLRLARGRAPTLEEEQKDAFVDREVAEAVLAYGRQQKDLAAQSARQETLARVPLPVIENLDELEAQLNATK